MRGMAHGGLLRTNHCRSKHQTQIMVSGTNEPSGVLSTTTGTSSADSDILRQKLYMPNRPRTMVSYSEQSMQKWAHEASI